MLTFFEHVWQRSERGYSNRDMTMAKLKILCLTPNRAPTNKFEGAAIQALGIEGIMREIEIREVSFAELARENT